MCHVHLTRQALKKVPKKKSKGDRANFTEIKAHCHEINILLYSVIQKTKLGDQEIIESLPFDKRSQKGNRKESILQNNILAIQTFFK